MPRILATLLVLTLVTLPAFGFEVGETVMVIRDTELKFDGLAVDKVWPGLTLRIGDIQGDSLWVSNGNPGWLEGSNVVALDKAIPVLTELIRQSPDDARLHNARALALAASDEYDQAIDEHNQAIALEPTAVAYGYRGLTWHAKGEYDKAIADFDESLRLDPQDAMTYNNRGLAWTKKTEYDKAVADFDQALKLEPKNALALFNRGLAKTKKGEYDKAIADYDDLLRLDPKDALAYVNRGIALWSKGENDAAIADYTAALKLDPALRAAYYFRGLARNSKREYDKGIEDYNEALRLDPAYLAAYYNRGVAWNAKGEYGKALADYTAANQLDPQNPYTYGLLAWFWATCPDKQFRDGQKAIEFATKACELTPTNTAGDIDTLAAAFAEAGNFPEAVKWQQLAIDVAPAAKKAKYQTRLDLYKKKKPYREEKKK